MVEQDTITKKVDGPPRSARNLSTIPLLIAVLALVAISVWLRMRVLNASYDIDSYDEGVYWQSLRAMSEGQQLYRDIFYSQPPFFLLSVFPTYILLGQTIWAARLGITMLSLVGLLGAFLLGKALAGKTGGFVALLLLAFQPIFGISFLKLQADGPSMALTLLSVALAFLWWKRPSGLAGICLAILCGIVLALSIGTKLFGLSALVPFGLLILAHLWRAHLAHAHSPSRLHALIQTLLPLCIGLLACAITASLLFVPFFSSWQQLIDGVINFHLAAGTIYKDASSNNLPIIQELLQSLLPLTALCGTIAALIRRDLRLWPLLAWLLATIALLWQQKPLFPHHFVILLPPLIGLSVLSVDLPQSLARTATSVTARLRLRLQPASLLALLFILIVVPWNAWQTHASINNVYSQNQSEDTRQNLRVAADLHLALSSDQQVITDAQFIAGLADRSTPPSLVDTSSVRITAGYVTAQQLIDAASSSRVHAVLIYSGRFNNPELAAFTNWVRQHFRLIHDYGNQRGLWVKM